MNLKRGSAALLITTFEVAIGHPQGANSFNSRSPTTVRPARERTTLMSHQWRSMRCPPTSTKAAPTAC